MEGIDVWGLVGSATPNGWNGPDQKFIPDFGVNEGYYYFIQGQFDSSVLPELERSAKLSEDIIRHIVLRTDS